MPPVDLKARKPTEQEWLERYKQRFIDRAGLAAALSARCSRWND